MHQSRDTWRRNFSHSQIQFLDERVNDTHRVVLGPELI
jgi:hypothetical protein